MRAPVWILLLAACTGAPVIEREDSPEAPPPAWEEVLAPGRLQGWAPSPYGAEDVFEVEEDRVVILAGVPLGGIHWTGELPRVPYEVEVRAQRVEGTDFFCGLTLPVAESHATVILGGWGGALCGLSCIDGEDASENATRTYRGFENGRWYDLRVEVGAGHIAAWVDGELLFHHPLPGHRIEPRTEVLPSRPLGIASFATRAAVSLVRWRSLEARP